MNNEPPRWWRSDFARPVSTSPPASAATASSGPHRTHPGRTVAYRADMDDARCHRRTDRQAPANWRTFADTTSTPPWRLPSPRRWPVCREPAAGTVVFVLQPAEESLAGAAAMLDDGVFARARPTEIHGLHCGPFPVGQFVVIPGFGPPGQDRAPSR